MSVFTSRLLFSVVSYITRSLSRHNSQDQRGYHAADTRANGTFQPDGTSAHDVLRVSFSYFSVPHSRTQISLLCASGDTKQSFKMSRPDEEELVDYDETAEETFAPPAAAVDGAKADGADKKGSYVGIHSTGFRSVNCAPFWAQAEIPETSS